MDIDTVIAAIALRLGSPLEVQTVTTIKVKSPTGIELAKIALVEDHQGSITADTPEHLDHRVEEIMTDLASAADHKVGPEPVLPAASSARDDSEKYDDHLTKLDGVYRASEESKHRWLAVSRLGTSGHRTRAEAREALAEAQDMVFQMNLIKIDDDLTANCHKA